MCALSISMSIAACMYRAIKDRTPLSKSVEVKRLFPTAVIPPSLYNVMDTNQILLPCSRVYLTWVVHLLLGPSGVLQLIAHGPRKSMSVPPLK